MLKIENICVAYQEKAVLDSISLTIEKPSITGIIGPNGAGKSTLIKSLLGLIPHRGTCLLDQEELEKVLYRVTYVEQKAALDFHFPIKVKECVSLGLYPQTRVFKGLSKTDWDKVNQALELVGLTDYGNRQISQLSGGQFQRVLIARCLVQEADVIFLDEPFVGIDSVSEEIIMETLRKMRNAGKTILMVHHDLSKVRNYFDQVILLNRQLIAVGPTETIFTEENLRKTYGDGLFFKGDRL